MARRTGSRWFVSLQASLYLLLIVVRGSEDAEDEYKNGRSLVLEYFLPINLPAAAVGPPLRREKRDADGEEEGSGEADEVVERGGEGETVFDGKKWEESPDNSTQNAFARLFLEKDGDEKPGSLAEGSGEVDEASESSREGDASPVPIIGAGEEIPTTTESVDVSVGGSKTPENRTEVATESLTSTEMIFDKSEDFEGESAEEETTTTTITGATGTGDNKDTTTAESWEEDKTTEVEKSTTAKPQTTTTVGETTTTVSVTLIAQDAVETTTATTNIDRTTIVREEVTSEAPTVVPAVIPQPELPRVKNVTETTTTTTTTTTTVRPPTTKPEYPSAIPPTTVEEAFQESKVGKTLEALPGNILQKENLSLAADPLLIANTRLMDSEENVQLSSSEPKRLGAYIVIGLILLSFSSLVGYITFRKRMNRKRQEFESNQESHDTEKALLSLSDYKDNSELEENHLKNNEITPIVVKSNSQINKFEKNTNFSSPKNLNTTANEKNIEKDNVLKSTAENLTQVIIEDSPKDVEEEKNVPNLEKLIVKTRIDQDSIPKKPIIINRSSAQGYMPIPQDSGQ